MTKKEALRNNNLQHWNHSSTLVLQKYSLLSTSSILSRLPTAHNTTASSDKLPCYDYVDSGKCQNTFENFLGPKTVQNTWTKDSKFSKMTKTKIFDWHRTLQFERQISTHSCDCGISWSLQQKTLVEREACWYQCSYQQCPKTKINKSN